MEFLLPQLPLSPGAEVDSANFSVASTPSSIQSDTHPLLSSCPFRQFPRLPPFFIISTPPVSLQHVLYPILLTLKRFSVSTRKLQARVPSSRIIIACPQLSYSLQLRTELRAKKDLGGWEEHNLPRREKCYDRHKKLYGPILGPIKRGIKCLHFMEF
jgi:hypothetical protein